MTTTSNTYFVARVRLWHGGAWRTPKTGKPVNRTFIQSVRNVDFLSCDALHPVLNIEADSARDARKRFREITSAQSV